MLSIIPSPRRAEKDMCGGFSGLLDNFLTADRTVALHRSKYRLVVASRADRMAELGDVPLET